MEENQTHASPSTPQLKFGKTPKKTFIQQYVRTPLQRLKESNSLEKNNKDTPVTGNPFEVKAESLYFSACSPSIFATLAKNKSDSGQFRWSIDHVSLLYPADIDETSVPELWVDSDHERQAQKAIDVFFSQNSIVPSPWSSESKDQKEIKCRRIRTDAPSNEVATQTMLTIPPHIDLAALLGTEFTYNDEFENVQPDSPSSSSDSCSSFIDSDIMSVSSLRRKLFTELEEECKTPSRCEKKDLFLAKHLSTPIINTKSAQSTPSDLLSSSPITPPNCSECCIIRSSPQMSPIAMSSQKSFRTLSFNERLDEESNSQLANVEPVHYTETSENSISFCMDTQDTGTLPSDASGKQDTGYVTGSMTSFQNVTSDITGVPSRITPVTEILDGYGFTSIASKVCCGKGNSICDMSIDAETVPFFKYMDTEFVVDSSKNWPLLPNNCSTPAFNL